MKNVKANIKKFLKDESGQGTVEYILILVGVLALGFIFKEQITEAISGKMRFPW